jgi:hypothetical protein
MGVEAGFMSLGKEKIWGIQREFKQQNHDFRKK